MTDTTLIASMQTGFIASAVVKRLVDEGRHVRATVRRQEAGDALRDSLGPNPKGTFEVAIVEDITASGAFKAALEGISSVFHMASPIPGPGKTDPKPDYLDPARAGTLALIKDAHETPSVKKVVLTSSVASVFDLARKDSTRPYTENDWNPLTYDQAIELGKKLGQGNAQDDFGLLMAIYSGSKRAAEAAAWDFVRENKSSFQLVAVHPAFVVGTPTLGGLGGSNEIIWQALTSRPVKQDSTALGIVDLSDTVEGHIQAMDRDAANGKRFLLVAEQPLAYEIINWAKENNPSLPFEAAEVPADADALKKAIVRFDTTASREVLGIKYKPVKQTISELANWASQVTKAQ